MAKGKRKVPDINSSSTADIAFLLLIFFLITTSMDTDRGLARLLPPPPEEQDKQNTDKIKERNILQVYLNKDDALMCGNDYISIDQLRKKAKEFIANVNNEESKPEKTQKNVEFFGATLVNDKHVISLQNDRGSSYQAYISVQNELVAAYNELRDELSQSKFQRNYADLNEEEQKAVREIFPQRISEAEPKKYGEKKK
ncbi:biopolymer transporter ExbD [Bacteroides pyogenes]|uniref:Biopolymer transporter ExbD n=1 Tax=Bacteroides pyogenes TaxID=310300 RepID=A0A5D3EGQ1_9BACE|nr:biopolymer transporter ExbD [Bacteroides pyogenes]TYK35028.1 biopolymer transporter ExbD [Bacteroides pyogenes]TYK38747.1 biopolymer transporter ExbD [Bacteroides pyogenes]TYK46585.1 biopolymer transporter ExbD [Bacteroides pyogenes]